MQNNKFNQVIWGVIGAGDVCEVKSAPAMMQLQHSTIKMVMRRQADKAADYACRHAIPHWTTNVDELLTDPEINAVYIATPPASHAELTIRAARAGKAVYVEKPMAVSMSECINMLEVCNESNVPLFVAYYRRTLPGYLKVKELVDKGRLGEIRSVIIDMKQPLQPDIIAHTDQNWRVDPEIAGGGYFHDLASHQLDFLDFLLGEITDAKGIAINQARSYPADDMVAAVFQFQNGCVGSGNWCFSASAISEKDSITIIGSKGELTFNSFGNPMLIRFKSVDGNAETFSFNHLQPIQKHLIQLIVNELRGEGRSPSTGISAARTTHVMEIITNPIRK
jgi:predicted dehydrogenase